MADQTNFPDPMGMWREWVSQSERQWNTFLNEAMATDEFSRSMGKMMDVYLNMQKSMNEVMGKYFTAMNLPTRTDVLTIGGRISAIEERLGRIETLLAGLASSANSGSAAAPAPRPARTKKPAPPAAS